MSIAIIGLGEVGRCFAGGLVAAGQDVRFCEARPAPAAEALSRSSGVAIHAEFGQWLSGVDWAFSCVTGAVALNVLESALPFLRPGQIYADFTTASPDTKREAAAIAARAGVDYVDVAIMGSIAMLGFGTPLLTSGSRAEAFCTLMTAEGGRATEVAGGAAGDAISLKIMRSIFTKGLEALAVELLAFADRMGARDKLFAQLRDLDEMPLQKLLEGLVRTHVIHARRRAHEVHDAAREMAAQGMASVVLPGVARRFENTAALINGASLAAGDISIAQALAMLSQTPALDEPCHSASG